jgi:L-cysteine desulfidase
MIKNIVGGGKYLTVSGGSGSTYVNNFSGAQGVGNMRYNTSSQNIEIYDGNNWVPMQSGYTTVTMTPEAETLLDWAKQKRNEEFESEALAKSNPTIADLLAQKNRIDEQINIVKTLIKPETTN